MVFLILSPESPAIHWHFLNLLIETAFYSHDSSHLTRVGKNISQRQKKLLGLTLFVIYQMGWKASWKQSFISSCCPLNALLFTQSKSSIAHSKYTCCLIYYLPDMLLIRRAGNQDRIQFLRKKKKKRQGQGSRRLRPVW